MLISDDTYRIVLSFDKQVNFKLSEKDQQNKISLVFYNTDSVDRFFLGNNLDRKFIKNISKIQNKSGNLSVVLELTPNVRLNQNYSAVRSNNFLVNLELKFKKLSNSSMNKISILKKYVIMIDPGHGGKDYGTIGLKRTRSEKDLVLLYAKELESELSRYPQYQVLLTRDKDIYMSPKYRKRKVHQAKADLFISLHVDSNANSAVNGSSIYTLSKQAMDEESLMLSQRKNKNDILQNEEVLKENKDIADVLIDMVYNDTQNASTDLAINISEELAKEVNMLYDATRSADFRVLKDVDTPAVLIELGYLSNPEEEKLLNSDVYKKRFIYALIQGINKYIKSRG